MTRPVTSRIVSENPTLSGLTMGVTRQGTGGTPNLWFEDLERGQVYPLGSVTAERDEMLAFARRYDPQWIHLDEEKMRASSWGGLIAPGMWTAAAVMRLYVDSFLSRAAPDSSPGMEELRWLAPVYPGDRLDAFLTVLETRPSSRGDHLGTVRLQVIANKGSDPVIRMTSRGWFYRRPS
ncbi:MaoC/PaaZ C-terminal domain-containing protein [Streptosporangium sp. NPDC087985]|uniref:MaoC/PaaZ C-terminal domain-containing protein n=1 Tax=Streptosporangium sp. NPDC087985 TaxID=3366196 RepID=UPI00381F67A7